MVRKSSIYLSLITFVLLFPGQLLALGLGEIETESALNQPLNAKINLISARSDELEEIRVELAPANVFDRVGVPRPYFLTQLKFKTVSLPSGDAVIRVTSKDPVREPFLTFLVEVTWPKGRLLREYTVLLDPPEFAQKQAPQIATPVKTSETQERVVEPEPVRSVESSFIDSAPAETTSTQTDDLEAIRAEMDRKLGIDGSEPITSTSSEVEEVIIQARDSNEPSAEELEETVVETVADSQLVAEEYIVKSGDTLYAVAKSAAQPGTSANQMMIAIQQANTNAFARNNINLLKKGAILRIPDKDEAQSISTSDARKQVSQQNALWREYRGIASQTVATNVDAPELIKEKSGVAEQAKKELNEEVKKPSSTKQDLNILAGNDVKESEGNAQVAGGEALKKLQNEITLTKERAESRAKEAEELKSRVQALESMLEKKEKILNIQNQQLKELQQQLSTETDKATAAEKLLQGKAAEPKETPEVKPIVEEIKKPVVEPLPEFTEPVVAGREISKPRLEPLPNWDSLPEIEPIKGEAVADIKPEVKPENNQAETPDIPETTSGVLGLLGSLKERARSTMIPLIAGVLLLLGGLWFWRKKSVKTIELAGLGEMPLNMGEDEDDEHYDDILDETIVTPQTNVASEVHERDLGTMQDLDLDDSSDLSPVTESSSDIELGEDVLEEADVYISYGLHQQAEDLLKDAIAKQPNRIDYKVKLAEVYYSQKDQQGFGQYAEKIKPQVGESSSHWQNIIAMGKELAPSNALFAGAAAAGAAVKSVVDKPEQADVDIGLQTVIDNPLSDANLEDTIHDNDISASDGGLEFNIDEPVATVDDPVASKIMQANEASGDLNIEDDDLEDDDLYGDVLDDADTDTDTDTEIDSFATGLHETASMNDLTKELEQIGMQTTMDDLQPLDIDENELDASGISDDTVAMQSDNLNIDSDLSSTDAEETAAYIPSTLNGVLGEDDTEQFDVSNMDTEQFDVSNMDTEQFDVSNMDTEQFDVSNMDTEFLDPAEQTVAQTHTDLRELGPPSLIEEVSTKLDLAKAFVDMGDTEAAKETLLEVIDEGDESQIKAAKDLMDKLGS